MIEISWAGGPRKKFQASRSVLVTSDQKKNFGLGDPLIEDFWPFFAEISKFAEISNDLFFNYLIKIYLSQYRRNEGSAALENDFEKSTSIEVFPLSLVCLKYRYLKWHIKWLR